MTFKTLRVGVYTLVLTIAAGSALLRSWSIPSEEPRGTTDPLAREAAELGVFAINTLPGAVYVVQTSDGLVLVDTGMEPNALKVQFAVKRLGLHLRDLKLILLTHCHGDHSNGAQQLRELTGAKVYAGQGDCAVLEAGGPWEAVYSAFDLDRELTTHPTTVDVELNGGETIALGDVRFDVIAAPGHTPGSTMYLMRRGDGPRVLFSGDAIMTYETLGTYAAYLSPRHRGDAEEYLHTLRRLSEMPPPDLIMPGHPAMSGGVDLAQARRAAAGWHNSLGAGIVELLDVLRRYESDGRDFLDGQLCEVLPGLHYLGDLNGVALYCFNHHGSLTLIDAPGGPELVSELHGRLAELGLDLAHVEQVLLTSCGAEATAGLAALVERTGCRVVAAEAGLDSLRPLCPGARFFPAENLSEEESGFVRAELLAGLGKAPVAYVFNWEGKRVLAAGQLPYCLHLESDQRLIRKLAERGNPADYARAMQILTEIAPDVWLPAVPEEEQNANLYGDDWERIVQRNVDAVRSD